MQITYKGMILERKQNLLKLNSFKKLKILRLAKADSLQAAPTFRQYQNLVSQLSFSTLD